MSDGSTDVERGQAQIAAADLACAIREFGAAQKTDDLKELATALDDLGTIRLEGDYDVLVARKLRAVIGLIGPISSGEVCVSATVIATVNQKMRELIAEVREALGH